MKTYRVSATIKHVFVSELIEAATARKAKQIFRALHSPGPGVTVNCVEV